MEKWKFRPSCSPGQVMFQKFALWIYIVYNIAVISYIVSAYVARVYTEIAEAPKMSNFFFPKKIFFFSIMLISSYCA